MRSTRSEQMSKIQRLIKGDNFIGQSSYFTKINRQPVQVMDRLLRSAQSLCVQNNADSSVLDAVEFCHVEEHRFNLGAVEVRRAGACDLLLAGCHIEEHRFLGGRPREVHRRLGPLGRSHAILQRTLVEDVRGKRTQRRVHAVLDL